MQPSPNHSFSLLELFIFIGIILAIAIAYIMNNGQFKNTTQQIIDESLVSPTITRSNPQFTPTKPSETLITEQCSTTAQCAPCQTCQEGLCVVAPSCIGGIIQSNLSPTPVNQMITPPISCPTGSVRVCEAGVCECLTNY